MSDPNTPPPDMDAIRAKLASNEQLSAEEAAAYAASLKNNSGPSDKAQSSPAIVEPKRRKRLWPFLLLGGGALAVYLWANQGSDKQPEPVPTRSNNSLTQKTTQSAEPTIEDGWKDAPIHYILQKHARLNYKADANSDSGYYAKAGSCVSAFQSRQRTNGFLQVDARDRNLNGGTRPGYVPLEALGEGRRASPGEVCDASLVSADKNTPLPGQPEEKIEHKPVPTQPEGAFRFAEFYTVYGDSNIRENPNRGDTPRAEIKDGSCVSQSLAKKMRGEFVHVTAMGGQVSSGWMLIGALRPAPLGTTENNCKAHITRIQPQIR